MDQNGHTPPAAVAPQLVITLDPATGSVQVSGPIGNRLVCYGMLEMAKEAIQGHAPSEAKRSGLTLLPPG